MICHDQFVSPQWHALNSNRNYTLLFLYSMVEAAIPTIQSMHLLSVVNFIHTSCIAKVKNDNILKRDQSLSYWSQVHSNSKRSTTERHLQGPGDSFLSDVYEESISTKTQGLIVLPKVSITMLQSSIVEEIISVAALDNVQVSRSSRIF